jgi:hypothetical protein
MNLPENDIRLFYKIWTNLIWHINERHEVVGRYPKPVSGTPMPRDPEKFIKIRDAMWESPQWIDEFLADPQNRVETGEEREIITNWRKYFVRDTFTVVKHLAKYSVFMSSDKLYAVHGITDSLEDMFPMRTPFLFETVLVPFKNRIIYDSLGSLYSVILGPGIRSSLNAQYSKLKNNCGIVETLGAEESRPGPPQKAKPGAPAGQTGPAGGKAGLPPGVKVPAAMADTYISASELVSQFCDERLDVEYREICLRALEKLCRKRPSPLLRGHLNTWACGIVHAVGKINFLFDKKAPVHSTADELAGWFGISKSASSSKSAEVSKLLGLSYFDREFSLRRILEANPFFALF